MLQSNALETYMHSMSAATAEPADALGHHETREPSLKFWPPLGTVQRRIVALDGITRPGGMRVAEIASLANRPGGPSTDVVLDTLARRGVVERLAGDRYRLAAQYRRLLTQREHSAPSRRWATRG